MTDLDTKKLQQAYPEVPEGFHNTVTETLDGLGNIKLVQKSKNNKRKIIAICVSGHFPAWETLFPAIDMVTPAGVEPAFRDLV